VNRLRFFFAWYDLWIGAYFDRLNRQLYICPLPCCVIQVDLRTYYAIMGQTEKYKNTVVGITIDETLMEHERLIKISKAEYQRRHRGIVD